MLIEDYTGLAAERLAEIDSGYHSGYASGETTPSDVLFHLRGLTNAAFRKGNRQAFDLLAGWTIPESDKFVELGVGANALFGILHTCFWNSALEIFERTIQTDYGWKSIKLLLSGGCLIGHFHYARFDVPDELNVALQGKNPWLLEEDIKKMCVKFIKDFVERSADQANQGGWERLAPVTPAKRQHSIFVSYKREENSAIAGRILEDLGRHFPNSSIFVDVVSINAGADFREAIRSALDMTDVVVAIIGKTWIPVSEWIQFELQTALALGIPIIPILVGDAKMAAATELPMEIREVAYKNALRLDEISEFKKNMQGLIDQLRLLGDRTTR